MTAVAGWITDRSMAAHVTEAGTSLMGIIVAHAVTIARMEGVEPVGELTVKPIEDLLTGECATHWTLDLGKAVAMD